MAQSTEDEARSSESSDQGDTDLDQTVDNTYRHVEIARVQVEQAQGGKVNRIVDRAGDLLDSAKGKMAVAKDVESIVEPALQSDTLKTIQEGIATFAESLPGVLKALDEVANIHPFIKVAVGAFRVVVELDVKRRDNDKKITVLFVEMGNMMEALIQLRSIKDEDTPGPNGTTIKARLQALVERTAGDIKDCANTCDTYSKKKLIVKVLKSSSWDEKFKGFLTLFAGRRKEFTLALVMHTGKAVEDVHRELNVMDAKLTTIITHLSTLVPPEQERLRDAVDGRGGPEAVLKDDRALASLVKYKPSTTGSAVVKHADPSHPERERTGEDDLALIRADLLVSADVAVQKNMETFALKFSVEWQRQIDAVQGIVQHESDRVIDSVLSGPHERIKDKVIYEIWKDMRWRGHVKARHFVLALRDHYLEHSEKRDARGEDRADMWALEHIDVNNVSAIAEAGDDDASGFITISEVNKFTSSRPRDWSLLKWLAWWSAGWHLSLAEYADKIDDLFEEMFALLPRIRAENHALAFRYLDMVWDDVAQLTWSLDEFDDNDQLPSRFAGHVEAEEKRLDENLKTFRYKIDARDTLSLITGPGWIETVLFPLLYLLIRRHLQIFRLCQSKVVIHHEELEDCANSIMCILDAVDERGYFLERIFKQRSLNPKRQFDSFACGLFDYWFNDEEKWTIQNLMIEDFDYPITSFTPTDVVLPDPKDILFYPTASEDSTVFEEESLTKTDLTVSGALKDILGRWYGFFEDAHGVYPAAPGMFTFFLHSAGEDRFSSNTVTVARVPCTITGRVAAKDGSTAFASTWTFGSLDTWFLAGVLAEDKLSITGTWCDELDDDVVWGSRFHLTRLAPEILIARPPFVKFDANRVDALWSFLRAYVHQRFQPRLSWKYIKEYVSRRKRYVDCLVEDKEKDEGSDSDFDSEPASYEEDATADDLVQLRGTFTYDQASLCYRILDMRMRASTSINGYECDVCGDVIHGVRYTCMLCSVTLDGPVDFCDKSECRETTAEIDETTHLPTHDVIKLRRPTLLYHDLPHLFRLAKETLKHTRNTFRKSSASRLQAGKRRSGQEDDSVKGNRRIPVRKHSTEEGMDSDARFEEGQNSASEDGSTGSHTDTDTGNDTSERTESSRSFGSHRMNSRRKRFATVPSCASCHKEVRWPCLVCVECEDTEDVFICEECDANPDGLSAGRHLPTHTLVLCTPPSLLEWGRTPGEAEKRLRALLDSQAAAQSSQVAALTERMSRIEGLLQAFTATWEVGRGDAQVEQTGPGTGGKPLDVTPSQASKEVE